MVKKGVGLAFLALVMVFIGVMAKETVPYFKFEYAASFLGTKSDATLQNRVFQWAFYTHISSSWVVILAGLTQFLPPLHRRFPKAHRWMGKVYILTILVLAAPSGLVLGYYANAGLPAKTGFMLQSIVWWLVTYLAWYETRQKQWLNHTNMMIRSYAITLAAMSLRTESYLMVYWLATKPIETYVTVTWLSWVGNLLIAEVLVYLGVGKKLLQTLSVKPT